MAEPPGKTITARGLVTLQDIDGLSVSPDGAWVAFQTRQADPEANRYRTAWYVVTSYGGRVRRVADAGDPITPRFRGRVNGTIITPSPIWSRDSAWIVYLRKKDGRTQIWRSHRNSRHTEQITDNEGDVQAFVLSRDGRRLLFETEASDAQTDAAIADESKVGLLYDSRFFPSYSLLPVLPRNTSFEMRSTSAASEPAMNARSIWAYDLAARRERPATEAERAEFAALSAGPAPIGRAAFRGRTAVSDGGALVWTEARNPEAQGGLAPLTIVAQLSQGKAALVCGAAECTSQRILGLWWRNNEEVVFARAEGVHRSTALYTWRPGEAAVRLILRTSSKLVGAAYEWNCAIAADRLICFYEEANHPRRLVAVNLSAGAIQTLYDPNPAFGQLDLGPPPRRIEIRTSSGVETYGYLVLPPHFRSSGRLPLVVVTYRCEGFLRGGIGDEYPIYLFAAQGFAVLCYNAPFPDDERLARMDWAAYGRWARGPGDPVRHTVQEGLIAAIDQLDSAGVIDRGRVGLTGLSFGAEMVSFALFSMPTLSVAIASGTEIGPSSTFLYGPAGQEALGAWGLGSQNSERWRVLSLSLNADRVQAPLLLHVPDREMLNALEVVTALKGAGRSVEMYVFPGEYHIKVQPRHRLAIYERNIDWMNFWLRQVEDAAPTKAAQYERWRRLRENATP